MLQAPAPWVAGPAAVCGGLQTRAVGPALLRSVVHPSSSTCAVPVSSLQLVHTVSAGERLAVPAREAVAGAVPDPELYEAYVALTWRCWAQRPEDRPGFAEIIQDLRWGGEPLRREQAARWEAGLVAGCIARKGAALQVCPAFRTVQLLPLQSHAGMRRELHKLSCARRDSLPNNSRQREARNACTTTPDLPTTSLTFPTPVTPLIVLHSALCVFSSCAAVHPIIGPD